MKIVTFLVFILIFTIGCDEDSIISSGEFESESDESEIVALSSQTDLNVENTNGIISVSASDTASNVYCYIKKKVKSKKSESDAQSHLSQINITYEKNSSTVKIKVDHPMSDDRTYETQLNIILPNKFNYDLSLGNGSISIVSQTKTLRVSLGNGSVTTNVTLLDTCFTSVSVGNGSVNFTILDNTNAILNASIGNGVISNNGLSFQNQVITNRQFSGTLGTGAGKIILSVGNGNITMNRK